MTDPYDLLCDQAMLNGQRISPLFRVFCSREGWRVCGANLMGDPVFTHAIHQDLLAACFQCRQLNTVYGEDPTLPFVEKIWQLLEAKYHDPYTCSDTNCQRHECNECLTCHEPITYVCKHGECKGCGKCWECEATDRRWEGC